MCDHLRSDRWLIHSLLSVTVAEQQPVSCSANAVVNLACPNLNTRREIIIHTRGKKES